MSGSSSPVSLPPEPARPSRLIVTLQMGGVFFALANIICVAILAWAYMNVKLAPKTIEVKGSAKKAIESDLITWSGSITARNADLPSAYEKLKADADRVIVFLREKGVPADEITLSSISTCKVYAREAITPPREEGGGGGTPIVIQSNRIEMYILTQSVSIESRDMKLVPEVARNVTTLIKDGVEIDSGSPCYLYTRLSELKIDMLAEATRDATTRATQIVTNANGSLGRLVEARMGVMQINPKGSTATSAEGNNDTTSFEKEIMAVVTARFELD